MSVEHGKHFHQDFSSMEKSYQGKWNCAVLATAGLWQGMPIHWNTSKTKKINKLFCLC